MQYTRSTFLIFAWPIVLLKQHTLESMVLKAAGALSTLLLYLSYDFNYYGKLTITPVNNIIYNSSKENLKNHGLRPWYNHLLIHTPLLFSNLLFSLRYPSTNLDWINWLIIASGLTILSLVPHQEPRFILPLLLPLSNLQRKTRASFFLISVNLALATFYSFAHQGSLVSCTQSLRQCAVFHKTYPPPQALTKHKVYHPMGLSDSAAQEFAKSLDCDLITPSWIEGFKDIPGQVCGNGIYFGGDQMDELVRSLKKDWNVFHLKRI